jgi:CRISPR system Cascade subunit CasA
MNPTFNLVDEPWIPVVKNDGVSVELSLRDVLLHAHEFHTLHGESPPIVAALYRLLLAVLHRIVRGPRSSSHWVEIWNAGAWEEASINAYLDRWYDRFYLFHPEFPFYQFQADDLRERKVIDLLPELASGNNATLFDHHTDESELAFSPQQAARALLFVQACSLAGGSGLAPRDSSDAPWGRGVVFLIAGDTLFQTLTLNLHPYRNFPDRGLENSEHDRPIWESTEEPQLKREKPLGYLDYLTWPTRTVYFHPEVRSGRLVVQRVSMGPGQRITRELLDPFYHFRKDKSRGNLVYRLREGRALWRDSASFLRFNVPEKVLPPETIRWLAHVVADGELKAHHSYRYMALGMATRQARVDFYLAEHLPLPGDYLQDEELVSRLGTALESAENVRSRLGSALARTASLLLLPTAVEPGGRKPDRKDVNDLLAHWAFDRFYWASLEIPFLELLETLPRDQEVALKKWSNVLQDIAIQVFERAERGLGSRPRALRAGVRGSGQLHGSLRKLFPKE